jgi:hypothetical protein
MEPVIAKAEIEKTLVNAGEIKHCQRRQKPILELQNQESPSVRKCLWVARCFYLTLTAVFVRVAGFGKYVVPLGSLGGESVFLRSGPNGMKGLGENRSLRRGHRFVFGCFHINYD